MSGNGEMQVSRVVEHDGLIKLIGGMGNGDGQGDDSWELGILILKLRPGDLRIDSAFCLSSECLTTLRMARFKLFARHWNASFSVLCIIRLERSCLFSLSFSVFPIDFVFCSELCSTLF